MKQTASAYPWKPLKSRTSGENKNHLLTEILLSIGGSCFGGGEGSRTPVRKFQNQTFSGCSSGFKISRIHKPPCAGQACGSFMIPSLAQSFARAVPLINGALTRRLGRRRQDIHCLRQRKLVQFYLQLKFRSGFLTQHSGTATRLSNSDKPPSKAKYAPAVKSPLWRLNFCRSAIWPTWWPSPFSSERRAQRCFDACRTAFCRAPHRSPASRGRFLSKRPAARASGLSASQCCAA